MLLVSLVIEQSIVGGREGGGSFGDHFRVGDHFGLGIISGLIWGSFRARDHVRVDLGIISGLEIISGAVQILSTLKSSNRPLQNATYNNWSILSQICKEIVILAVDNPHLVPRALLPPSKILQFAHVCLTL